MINIQQKLELVIHVVEAQLPLPYFLLKITLSMSSITNFIKRPLGYGTAGIWPKGTERPLPPPPQPVISDLP